MTKDRLKELQKNTSWTRVSYRRLSRQQRNQDVQYTIRDGNIQFTSIPVDDEHPVDEFLAQIDLIQTLISKVQELAKQVEQIHMKMLEPTASPKLGQQLDDKTSDIKRLAYDISAKLKRIEQIQEDQNDTEKASALWRMRESQIFAITRHFRDIMNRYNQESVTHRDRCKKIILRELEITGNQKTDNEVEDMIENGFPGTFNFSIMADVEKARRAANEIEARHRDIAKLETSLRELHDMFVDLALLVEIQGTMIDNIEHNVSKAADFIGSAAKEVKEAEEKKTMARKSKIYICIIVIVVILLLIFIFGAYTFIQKKLIGR